MAARRTAKPKEVEQRDLNEQFTRTEVVAGDTDVEAPEKSNTKDVELAQVSEDDPQAVEGRPDVLIITDSAGQLVQAVELGDNGKSLDAPSVP